MDTASGVEVFGVMPFANKADKVSARQADIIADIFTRILAQSRNIAVVDRERFEDIAKEQKLSISGLVDPRTAVSLGKIANCKYIICGSIIDFFQPDDTKVSLFLNFDFGNRAFAQIEARIVNVETNEAMKSFTEKGYSSSNSKVSLEKVFDVPEFNNKGTEAIIDAASRLAFRIREVTLGEFAHILSTNGKGIELNIGASDGVKKGGLYLAYFDGHEIRDIDGTLLDRRPEPVAVIKISDVYDNSSLAELTKKGGNISNLRRGDKIRIISEEEAKNYSTKIPQNIIDRHDKKDSFSIMPEPIPDPVPSEPTNLENQSTIPEEVIPTYGLEAKRAENLIKAHNSFWNSRNKRKNDVYQRFADLVKDNNIDYLAAYRAGLLAQELHKNDEAKTWFDKALSINPKYKPAQDAKEKLNSAPVTKSKTTKRKRK